MARPISTTPPHERVLARVEPDTDGCLIWAGATIRGYGAIKVGGRKGQTLYTHRVVWEAEHGPIPEGMTIDHLCFKPLCQRVACMELVTRGENARRANLRQTHCKYGHLLGEGNIVKRKAYPNRRDCATCHRERQRRYSSRG